MKPLFRIKNKAALTLIECVLALSLGALILAPLAMSFSVGLKTWRENEEHNQLLQSARLALDRMTNEARYAYRIMDHRLISSRQLTLVTSNMFDDDTYDESVLYKHEGYSITRQVINDQGMVVDVEPPYILIGRSQRRDPGMVLVTSFKASPLKVSSGGTVVPLETGDLIGLASAVLIELILTDNEGDNFTISSMVNLRNKQ